MCVDRNLVKRQILVPVKLSTITDYHHKKVSHRLKAVVIKATSE